MTIAEIEQQVEEGQSLKQIAQAYSEIANQKIKRIREAAERNRLFFKEISSVYGIVKTLASKNKLTISKAKKRLVIIITSNFRFYGPINSSLIEFYIKNTSSMETDRVIIGNTALEYFKANNLFQNYQAFILKNDQPDTEELTKLTNIITQYNQVLIFYSKFKSLLVQYPTFDDITASSQKIESVTKTNSHFIFEPELAKILTFFDTQILILLIEATFLESEVARTASRFISMDQAETQANKYIDENNKLKSYLLRNIKNNQILESLIGIASVKKSQQY